MRLTIKTHPRRSCSTHKKIGGGKDEPSRLDRANPSRIGYKTQSQLIGSPHTSHAAELATATTHDATFFIPSRQQSTLQQVHAGVTFIDPETPRPEGPNYLLHADPLAAFEQWATLIAAFSKEPQSGFQRIHPSAIIHETAQLASDVQVGPNAVIDQHVNIGPRTKIGPGAILGPNTTIGTDCHIHARVVIEANTRLGNRVVIYPGAVILQITDKPRKENTNALATVGNVELKDDVEVGANTTIDRAKCLASTIVEQGTKIDNLVQIAHNVKLGKHNLIVAQTGIAGSSSTGDYVILAGQVGVNDHIHIASGTIVAACSGIMNSIDKPGKYSGIPATTKQEHHRQLVYLKNIKQHIQLVQQLQKEIEELKKR